MDSSVELARGIADRTAGAVVAPEADSGKHTSLTGAVVVLAAIDQE